MCQNSFICLGCTITCNFYQQHFIKSYVARRICRSGAFRNALDSPYLAPAVNRTPVVLHSQRGGVEREQMGFSHNRARQSSFPVRETENKTHHPLFFSKVHNTDCRVECRGKGGSLQAYPLHMLCIHKLHQHLKHPSEWSHENAAFGATAMNFSQ